MLRDLVKDVHTEAENRPFAKLLMSGKISPIQYAEYLYQQEPMYHALEKRADELGILKDIPNIKRGLKITADFHNLQIAEPFELFQSTKEYCTYVSKISQQQCWAHIYVRHFGDMYGGNMIKKLVTNLTSISPLTSASFPVMRNHPKRNKPHKNRLFFRFTDVLY